MVRSHSGIFHGSMVGREEELSRTIDFLGGLDTGYSPGILSIWSSAGVGKSRLVYEASVLRDDLNWLYVSADEVVREKSDPFVSFMSNWFGQDPCNTPEENSARFSEIWEGLVLGVSLTCEQMETDGLADTLKHQEPVIRTLLGLRTGETLFGELDPRSRSEHTHLAVSSLFRGLASLGPAVLVIDSIQWFSTEALGFLDGILCRRLPQSLAVITMGRHREMSTSPETDGSEWAEKAIQLNLGGISKDSVPGFFSSLTGSRPSDALSELVWGIAGGIPIFIEQLSGFLSESGLLTDEEMLGYLGGMTSIESPLDLTSLLSLRLDRQSAELRLTASSASVLGMEFDTAILGLMHPGRELAAPLEEGVRLGIWAPAEDERKHVFSHVLFRDHIYGEIDESTLEVLHGRAGTSIEELHGRRRDNLRQLATHWEVAGEEARAISCLREAAALAEAEYRNSDAADIYRRLRNLLRGTELCEVDLSLAGVLDNSGMWSQGIDLLRNCLPFLTGSDSRRDALLQGDVRLLLGDILCRRGNYEEAEEEILLSRRLFRELGETCRETAARTIQGRILRHLGRHASAASILEDCLQLAREEEEPDLLCSALGILGSLRLQMGDPESSRTLFGEKIRLAEKHGLRRREASALLNMLNLHRNAGDIREASACYHRLVAVSEETGDVNAVAIASNSMGSILVSRRDYEGAHECFATYLEVSRRKSSMHGIATATCNMGVACMLMGEQSRAIECFMSVIDVSTRMMNRQNTAVAYANMGRLFCEMGRYECAIDCAETLMELADCTGFRSGAASACMIKAGGFHGLGELPEALEEIDLSLAITREIREWRKLPTRLLRRALILFDTESGAGTRQCFEETLDAARRFDQPDTAFTAGLYLAVLDASCGKDNVQQRFASYLDDASSPEQEASACYHYFMCTGSEEHGVRALRLYRGILRERLLGVALQRTEELERELDESLH